MKRFFLLSASAVGLGVLIALVIHAALPHPGSSQRGKGIFTAVAQEAVSLVQPVAPVTNLPAASVAPKPVADRTVRSIGAVLLAEPVVILYDNDFSGRKLPRGSRVEVLRDDGAFLKVRAGGDIVVIPRSATIQGILWEHIFACGDMSVAELRVMRLRKCTDRRRGPESDRESNRRRVFFGFEEEEDFAVHPCNPPLKRISFASK